MGSNPGSFGIDSLGDNPIVGILITDILITDILVTSVHIPIGSLIKDIGNLIKGISNLIEGINSLVSIHITKHIDSGKLSILVEHCIGCRWDTVGIIKNKDLKSYSLTAYKGFKHSHEVPLPLRFS